MIDELGRSLLCKAVPKGPGIVVILKYGANSNRNEGEALKAACACHTLNARITIFQKLLLHGAPIPATR